MRERGIRLDARARIADDGAMKRLVFAAALIALAAPARADFSSCVASLRADASAKGVSAATLEAAFGGLQPDMKVLEFETSQPEFKTPIWDYMAGLVDDERVVDGKAAMAKNASALAAAERRFGVDRHVLAAIWGVESNFGEDMGKRPLVQSLSTLAEVLQARRAKKCACAASSLHALPGTANLLRTVGLRLYEITPW